MTADQAVNCGFEWREIGTGRVLVDCDENCRAYDQPVTMEEYKAALIHWKEHSWLSGCSHAC